MLLRREPPVDFVQLILELRGTPHRLTFAAIAAAINVDVNTLKGWFYHAHQPKFEAGKALLNLHAELNSRVKRVSGMHQAHAGDASRP